jgi:hypothetical protein
LLDLCRPEIWIGNGHLVVGRTNQGSNKIADGVTVKITRKIEPRGVTVIADDAAGAAWFVALYALDRSQLDRGSHRRHRQ